MFKTLLLALAVLTVNATPVLAEDDGWLHTGPVLIKNVTVIDGRGTQPLVNRDILVRDGRIADITVTGLQGDLPAGTRVIDGRGHTVMPGLMDLHVHLEAFKHARAHFSIEQAKNASKFERLMLGTKFFDTSVESKERYLDANLYAGVTTMLEVGGDMAYGVATRDAIKAGEKVGPTLHISGETIGSLTTNTHGSMQIVSDEVQAEIQSVIKEKADKGIRNIKLYAGIANWQARHLVHEAKKYDMTVIADLWGSNLSSDVMEITGIDGYAHGTLGLTITRENARWMADNDKFVTFTLAIFESMTGGRVFDDLPEQGHFNNPLIVDIWGKQEVADYYDVIPGLMAIWHDDTKAIYADQLFGSKRDMLNKNMQVAKMYWEEGVLVGMGTDAPWPPGNWPGESMHRELELHVKAGIPPLEAIKMATHNNAKYLRVLDDVGTVETGKIADMLVVRGNPAENIADTRNIAWVIKGGKLVNREALKHK